MSAHGHQLRLTGMRFTVAGRTLVAGATIVVAPGEVAGLVGPNGSGKSTLLRMVYRHLRPAAGTVGIETDDATNATDTSTTDTSPADIWRMPPKRAARWVAALAQDNRTEFDLTVTEMVAMGRTPHKSTFAPMSTTDREIVADAISRVGMTAFTERRYASLSGGERQRVLVARAIAQRTPVLVLDEPTNHLDVRHQFELLELVTELGLTTLVALHDLNLAAGYCDRVHVLREGAVVASGEPADVLSVSLLRDVFGVDAEPITHPRTGRPHLLLSTWDGADEAKESGASEVDG